MKDIAYKKDRLHWVDIAKGMLILMLIIHHLSSAFKLSDIDTSEFLFLTCWQPIFTTFFMPAFFIISGYCSNFSKGAVTFWLDLAKHLILPLLLFEFFTCLFWTFVAHKDNITFGDVLSFWIRNNGTHFWFLNALIFSKIILWMFHKICKSLPILMFMTFFLLATGVLCNQLEVGSNFLYIRHSFVATFFVATGFLLKNNSGLSKYLDLLGVGFPYMLLLLYMFHRHIPVYTANMNVSIQELPIFIVLSIGGTMALFSLAKKLVTLTWIEFYGRNTLLIYLIHFVFLYIITQGCIELICIEDLTGKFFLIISCFCLEILVLTLGIYIFKYKPFCWLLGKF